MQPHCCDTTGGCEKCRPSSYARNAPPDAHYVGDDCSGGHREESKSGFKFDSGKLRYDLVPPYALSQLVQVYTDGAAKYGDVNYLKGMAYRRVLAALMRHVEAYRTGESTDPDSGSPHLAHAAWACFTLITYELYDLGEDDREMTDNATEKTE